MLFTSPVCSFNVLMADQCTGLLTNRQQCSTCCISNLLNLQQHTIRSYQVKYLEYRQIRLVLHFFSFLFLDILSFIQDTLREHFLPSRWNTSKYKFVVSLWDARHDNDRTRDWKDSPICSQFYAAAQWQTFHSCHGNLKNRDVSRFLPCRCTKCTQASMWRMPLA